MRQRNETIQSLADWLGLPAAEVAIADSQRQAETDPLSMLLWQYGFISTLDQLNCALTWETAIGQPPLGRSPQGLGTGD